MYKDRIFIELDSLGVITPKDVIKSFSKKNISCDLIYQENNLTSELFLFRINCNFIDRTHFLSLLMEIFEEYLDYNIRFTNYEGN